MTHTFRASVTALGPVTLWDFSTVCRVLDAYAEAAVDPAHLLTEEGRRGIAEALVRRFQRMVGEWFATSAVDDMPRAEDCRVHSRKDAARSVWVFRVDWWPTVQAVELVGGHRDGDVIALAKPLDLHQLRLPERPSHAYGRLTQDYDAGVYPERFTVQTYVLSGWNNAERRWRYSLEATR